MGEHKAGKTVVMVDFLIDVPTPDTGSTPRPVQEDICPECGGEGEVTATGANGTEEREPCPLWQGSGRAEA